MTIATRNHATAAEIAGVATHLPERVVTNDELALAFTDWSAEKILSKTGIRERRIAAEGETAGDLAFRAAEKLFAAGGIAPEDVDFIILCTQAPDHVLPTTACLLQDRLGCRRNIGALDINLGCSGFVYGLSLASSLIAAGSATKVLLLTADTYSKYINSRDKSVRTLFGDGAAATLVVASGEGGGRIGPFVYGTDGRGGRDLIVEAGGFRLPRCSTTAVESDDGFGNIRSREDLFMNGAAVMSFTLREVPRTYRELLERSGLQESDVDFVLLHQANKFMLDSLQRKLGVDDNRMPRRYEDIGNTVSSTIPFVLADLLTAGELSPGKRVVMIGFGVGLSWAGAHVHW